MAEHQNKRDESETTATTPGGKEGAVESKSRGLFDFLGTSTTTPSSNEGAVETKSRGYFDFLGKKEEKIPKEEEMAS